MHEADTFAGPSPRLLISHEDRIAGSGWIAEITEYLEPRSVRVQRAYSGRQALGFIERGGIDIAILADELPRMRALSLLGVVRSIDADLPCVMVTRNVSRSSLQRALELHAFSVLAEPVDGMTLKRVLAGLFRIRFQRNLGDSGSVKPAWDPNKE